MDGPGMPEVVSRAAWPEQVEHAHRHRARLDAGTGLARGSAHPQWVRLAAGHSDDLS